MTLVKLNIDGVDYAVTPALSPTGLLLVPAGITPVIDKLDALTGWIGVHDAATIGTAAGTTVYPVTVGGRTTRSFSNTYTNFGGIRYHCRYDLDIKSSHFVYAGDLYFDSTVGLAQMELDNNQVTADGKTYIFGAQFNANDGKLDITKTDTACHWVPTAMAGNPKNWPLKTWLHFEIATHRDNLGNITYDAAHFNGITQKINATMPSSLMLGWGVGILLANFQLGGDGASGSITAYASNLQVAKW